MRFWFALLLCWLPAFSGANVTAMDAELRQKLDAALNDPSYASDRYDAEVWLVDMDQRLRRYVQNGEERLEILRHVYFEAQRVNLQPELVMAVIEVESHFDRFAISVAGARGLMQVMPFWLKELDRENDNLFQIPVNLRMGTTILRHYLDREKGHVENALAAYNGSLGRKKYPNKVFRALRQHWFVQ